jgi:hypothetical protein
MAKSKYAKYIVTDLKMPLEKQRIDADYRKYARRILWMDENVVPGAFHMNTAWFMNAAATLENVPHTHDDPEIIGFFGSDPDHPNNLNAEVEFWIEGEKQVLNKSMISCPQVFCPMILTASIDQFPLHGVKRLYLGRQEVKPILSLRGVPMNRDDVVISISNFRLSVRLPRLPTAVGMALNDSLFWLSRVGRQRQLC